MTEYQIYHYCPTAYCIARLGDSRRWGGARESLAGPRDPHLLIRGPRTAPPSGISRGAHAADRLKTTCRWTFWQDIRFAARLLIKDRWFTLAAATALALGIGANAAVFTFVNAALVRGLPFHEPDRIMALWTEDDQSRQMGTSELDYEDLPRGGEFVLGAGRHGQLPDQPSATKAGARAGPGRLCHGQPVPPDWPVAGDRPRLHGQ